MSSNAARLGDSPPVYRIDLSLPPAERYVELARAYRDKMRSLTSLFDEVVRSIHPDVNVAWVHRAARLLLRRLYTDEETEEIRGMSREVGIDMYFLVALNVLLDSLMGCTSGAARSKEDGTGNNVTKMLHFRTLDWGMDSLREMIVQLEFIRSSSSSGGSKGENKHDKKEEEDEVIATSITYVGYVGVLTGVRKGLSLSLNFRPYHDTTGRLANFRFYASHVLVLLGLRQSISSLLRGYIIPPEPAQNWLMKWLPAKKRTQHFPPPESLASITATLPQIPTTSAYLIFSDGNSTLILEKDHRSAVTLSSPSFIVVTNNDRNPPFPEPSTPGEPTAHSGLTAGLGELSTVDDLIEDSDVRLACMQSCWDRKVRDIQSTSTRRSTRSTRASTRQSMTQSLTNAPTQRNPRSSKRTPSNSPSREDPSSNVTATAAEILEWLGIFPITNELTHFATVMDPSEGKVVWVRRYIEPVTE
ncbi:hypothetical protein AJ80_06724 [Polytolypa hystricis UAMH7299]|uniref:ceramidase n=1 Tax=Polytolypa hystricis (strain UAMH7299) TaxID=1447883 RepID=A0A2B7XVB5_POLH7|nr:hypothetical protein AJ80_06724 [Polytolypa hystricis UAMH7299]